MNYEPRVIEITTAKVCGVDCKQFCPNSSKFRPAYGDSAPLLTLDNFKLAMSHIPKDVWIVFAGHSEPFMNPDAIRMIEFAHSEGRKVHLYSTLVGLRAQDVQRLKPAIDKFVWHVPDNRGIAHVPTDGDFYWDTVKEMLAQLDIGGYSRMDGNFVSNDRAGNCEGVEPFHFKGPFYCRKLTTPQMVMLPDGRTLLCCMDWDLKHIVGNLFTQTFDEIANDRPFRAIADQMLRWDGDVLCRSCTVPRPLHKELVYRTYKKVQGWMGGSQGGPKAGGGHGLGTGQTEQERKVLESKINLELEAA